MELINSIFLTIEGNIILAWTVLAAAFFVLAKSADLFVDSSVSVAEKFKIPKLVIGIVLISIATTTPELSVSVMSAFSGKPQMALGNAIGSVICDDGLALALAGIFTVVPIMISPTILKISGIFLVTIESLTFLFVLFDNTLSRSEGITLVVIFVLYMTYLLMIKKESTMEEPKGAPQKNVMALLTIFILSLISIIIASKFIIVSTITIARSFGIPETIVALTVVAFGTSIPEVATCVTAARKKQGAIAVGNIIGADIMNISWVAGASAIVNPLTITHKETMFMFPAMFVIVGAMLIMLWYKFTLTKAKGLILLSLYLVYIYLVVFVLKFNPHG